MIEILFPGMVEDQPEYYQDDKLLVTGTGTGTGWEALEQDQRVIAPGEPSAIAFVDLSL